MAFVATHTVNARSPKGPFDHCLAPSWPIFSQRDTPFNSSNAPPATARTTPLILWSNTKRLYVAIVAVCALASTGCSSSSSGAGSATCAEATPRLYGLGCMLVVNGADLSESQALAACNEIASDDAAGTCSCASDLNAVLNCWESESACGYCETQLATLQACSANCP
jgi:hypothetical protein